MNANVLAWGLLVLSVLCELAGNIALRYSNGFSKPIPTILTYVSYAFAIWFMALTVKRLELGPIYAIWAGSSVAITAIIGVIAFSEVVSLPKIIGILLITAGVFALNLEQ